MKKAIERRPVVETLESLTLLSGVSGAAAPAVAALVAKATLPNPLVLSGSLHGSFKAKANGQAALSGTSTLSPLGKVTIAGAVTTSTTGGAGTLKLVSKQGTLLLNVNSTVIGQQLSGTYVITGGTKALANESGTGTVVATLSTAAARGKFTATFT